MNSIIRKILSCFTRFVLYGTIKIFVVQSLGLIPFVNDYIDMKMTMSEVSAIVQNEQLMALILIRDLVKDEYKLGVYILYVLYELFDMKIDFAWKFSMYWGVKCVLKQVLVWLLNKNWRIYNYIDPNRINTMLTYTQIDSIEFDKPNFDILFGICRGIFFDMLNRSHIFMCLKQLYYAKKTPDVYASIP